MIRGETWNMTRIDAYQNETLKPRIVAIKIQTLTRRRPFEREREREREIVAAFLLAVLGGNPNPSSGDIKDILGSVGADADDEKIEFLLSEVKGKDITELIASGREKFASVPSGGGATIAVAPSAGGGGGAASAAAAEPKKEEKVEEKEESDEDMGFSLFD